MVSDEDEELQLSSASDTSEESDEDFKEDDVIGEEADDGGGGEADPPPAAGSPPSDDDRKSQNVAALVRGNLVVRRQLLIPRVLSVSCGAAVARKPFKPPCQDGYTDSNEQLTRRLWARKKFVPWGSSRPTLVPITNLLHIPAVIENEKSEVQPLPPGIEPLILWQTEGPCDLNTHLTQIEVDSLLVQYLRPHQREGVQFMFDCVSGLSSTEGISGCILADDMGLGKTLQSITLLYTLLHQGFDGKPMVKRALIVTPTSLVSNWESEINKWVGGRVQLLSLCESTRADVLSGIERFLRPCSPYQVLILSYETFRMHSAKFEKNGCCDLLICDEAHRLKNDQTLTNRALAGLPCSRRILLSGTPMQNDLEEFYAMVNFTNPGILGDAAYFRRYYEVDDLSFTPKSPILNLRSRVSISPNPSPMEASTAVRSSPYACTTPRPAIPAAARRPNCISFNLHGGRSPNLSNSSPWRPAFATPRRRSLITKAATEPSPIAPLKLESPTGQFLSQILVNYPHLLPAAVDHQLHQLQADRDTEKSKGKDEPAPPATDLVLYRRITEVRANERRRALEEILYAMVVQKFVEAEVSLVPALSQPADSSQRVDQWPSEEEKLEQLHSSEAFEMIKNHLTLILGHRLADSNSVAPISKLRVGQVYAASVMYGYFLKRVDQRFQLEKSMKTLPWGSDEEESAIRQAVADEPQLSDQLSTPPEWTPSAATIGSAVDDHGIRQSRLRSYVMSFDKETLHRYASIRSKEAFSIIEKHTEALFGRPEIMINPGGGIDSSKDEIIKISFAGLKRLILEAVTFGSFLWDVESYVDSRYHFVTN